MNPLVGRSYYRIRRTQPDGQELLSSVLVMESALQNQLRLMNHPVAPDAALDLQLTLENPESLGYQLIDVKGRRVRQGQWELAEGHHRVQIDRKDIVAGTYFLTVRGQYFKDPRPILLQ